jgi:hypothetical protein
LRQYWEEARLLEQEQAKNVKHENEKWQMTTTWMRSFQWRALSLSHDLREKDSQLGCSFAVLTYRVHTSYLEP